MSPIRILLVDDDPLFRDGLQTILSVQPGVEVVGEAGNGLEAVQLAGQVRPDVVLMDWQMPLLDGLAAARRLKTEQPHCRVIILTTFQKPTLAREAAQAGVVAVLDKDISAAELAAAIQTAMRSDLATNGAANGTA